MKTYITLALVSLLVACNTPKKDKTAEIIKTEISKNALGMDIKYTPISTDSVAIVKCGESLNNYFKDIFKRDIADFDSVVAICDRIIMANQMGGNIDGANVLNFAKQRITLLRGKKADEVDYRIVKHHYTFTNPGAPAPTDITNYYYFNGNDSLIGYLYGKDFDLYKGQYVTSATEPYEMALFKFSPKEF